MIATSIGSFEAKVLNSGGLVIQGNAGGRSTTSECPTRAWHGGDDRSEHRPSFHCSREGVPTPYTPKENILTYESAMPAKRENSLLRRSSIPAMSFFWQGTREQDRILSLTGSASNVAFCRKPPKMHIDAAGKADPAHLSGATADEIVFGM